MVDETPVEPGPEEEGRRGGAAAAYTGAYAAPAERARPAAWAMAIGNVRWDAIWAGLVLAFGVQLILGSLVVAILISAGGGTINTTALGVLMAIVAIIALFSGGWATGRMARAGVTGGIWHAVWLWGLLVTLSAVAVAIGAGSLLGAGLTTDATATTGIAAAWWTFAGIAAALIGTVFGGWVGGARSAAEGEVVT